MRIRALAQLPEPLRAQARSRLGEACAPPHATARTRRDEEHRMQADFIAALADLAREHPEYAQAVRRTHATPNGGGRTPREAGRLKAEGVRRGVSDLFVALPAAGRAGLYIEMKAGRGRLTPEQKKWIAESRALGYAACCCRSLDEALEAWRSYVEARRASTRGSPRREMRETAQASPPHAGTERKEVEP